MWYLDAVPILDDCRGMMSLDNTDLVLEYEVSPVDEDVADAEEDYLDCDNEMHWEDVVVSYEVKDP